MLNLKKIFKDSLFFAWQEGTGSKPVVQRIRLEDAEKLNQAQHGIFFTIQAFNNRRIKENLTRINCWAIDMDASVGTKLQQQVLIEKSPLVPSLVVETKSGYHVYWFAKDAKSNNYRGILEKYLIPFFRADKNAKDLCRVLRWPGFNHWKDPTNPFLVSVVHEEDFAYTEAEVAYFFGRVLKKEPKVKNYTLREIEHMCGGTQIYPFQANSFDRLVKDANFWTRANRVDCLSGLRKLSGSLHVDFESYDFVKRTSGGYTIIVNGKPSAAWIDENGMIGSTSNGGPTLVNWLLWFKNSPQKVAEIMKGYFDV